MYFRDDIRDRKAHEFRPSLICRKYGTRLRHSPLAAIPTFTVDGCNKVEATSTNDELKSYKAEVRAKTIAVGKAEIILNEVCLLMVRRVGRAEGTQMSDNKGGVLLEVRPYKALQV